MGIHAPYRSSSRRAGALHGIRVARPPPCAPDAECSGEVLLTRGDSPERHGRRLPDGRDPVDHTTTVRRADPTRSFVEHYPDLVYVQYQDGHLLPSGRKLRFDLLKPMSASPTPLVVFIKGGGFRNVHRVRYLPALVRLAERGVAVASVDYRTSNEARFPAPLDDVREALRYLRAHASEFNLGPAAVAVWGNSAGATIATIVGAAVSEGICAVASWYGMHDPLISAGLRASGSPLRAALGAPDEDDGRWFRPADHITPGSPPTFLLHGTEDRTVPVEESLSLAVTLAEQGVPHELMLVEGGRHDFAEMSTRTDALERTSDFLHRYLLRAAAAGSSSVSSPGMGARGPATRSQTWGGSAGESARDQAQDHDHRHHDDDRRVEARRRREGADEDGRRALREVRDEVHAREGAGAAAVVRRGGDEAEPAVHEEAVADAREERGSEEHGEGVRDAGDEQQREADGRDHAADPHGPGRRHPAGEERGRHHDERPGRERRRGVERVRRADDVADDLRAEGEEDGAGDERHGHRGRADEERASARPRHGEQGAAPGRRRRRRRSRARGPRRLGEEHQRDEEREHRGEEDPEGQVRGIRRVLHQPAAHEDRGGRPERGRGRVDGARPRRVPGPVELHQRGARGAHREAHARALHDPAGERPRGHVGQREQDGAHGDHRHAGEHQPAPTEPVGQPAARDHHHDQRHRVDGEQRRGDHRPRAPEGGERGIQHRRRPARPERQDEDGGRHPERRRGREGRASRHGRAFRSSAPSGSGRDASVGARRRRRVRRATDATSAGPAVASMPWTSPR
jgi:acetyl esterase/lipase